MRTLILTCCLMLATFCFVDYSLGDTNTQNIYYKSIPVDLENSITNDLVILEKKHPCSAEESSQLRTCINSINVKYPALDESYRKSIKEKSEKAMPAITAALLSTNDTTRLKALVAIGQLLKPHEYYTDEYQKFEKLLVAVLHRSLHDRNEEVRRGASASLAGIAREHGPVIPEYIKRALETAKKDPDLKVRQNTEIATVDSK